MPRADVRRTVVIIHSLTKSYQLDPSRPIPLAQGLGLCRAHLPYVDTI